jgi:hypothetical protein
VSYDEVVFSPTGVAKMNHVENGKVQTVATAAYQGGRNVWFDVQLDATHSVWVNREKIFDHVPLHLGQPDEGGVGLITHWAPGRFDDVSSTKASSARAVTKHSRAAPWSKLRAARGR